MHGKRVWGKVYSIRHLGYEFWDGERFESSDMCLSSQLRAGFFCGHVAPSSFIVYNLGGNT
jgi:hypothetical protein